MRYTLLLLSLAILPIQTSPALVADGDRPCVSARTYGDVSGDHSPFPPCEQTPTLNCRTLGGGLEPHASVEATACYPRP
jgi:hypothetical protein